MVYGQLGELLSKYHSANGFAKIAAAGNLLNDLVGAVLYILGKLDKGANDGV